MTNSNSIIQHKFEGNCVVSTNTSNIRISNLTWSQVCVRRPSIWEFKFSAACLRRRRSFFFVMVKEPYIWCSSIPSYSTKTLWVVARHHYDSRNPAGSQVVPCAGLRGRTGEGQRMILKTWRAGRNKGKNGDWNLEDRGLNQTQSMAEAVMQFLLLSLNSIMSPQVQRSSTSKFSMYRPFLLTLNSSQLDWNQLSTSPRHEWDYIASSQCECPRCGQFDLSNRKQSICHQVNWQGSRHNPVKRTEIQNTWKS